MQMMAMKMAYHSERQDQLSRNIVNADTPNYIPSDLKELDFNKVLRAKTRLQMARTSEVHSEGTEIRPAQFRAEKSREYFERKPVKNAVNIEEQMMKMNENSFDFQTTTSLYQKTTGLFKAALGKNTQ